MTARQLLPTSLPTLLPSKRQQESFEMEDLVRKSLPDEEIAMTADSVDSSPFSITYGRPLVSKRKMAHNNQPENGTWDLFDPNCTNLRVGLDNFPKTWKTRSRKTLKKKNKF